eukprot:snap_masked-scaffold_36-processed-gene-2.81-mRNA-1 protein AED:0.16 eAED:0.16 QI:0/-1/0/1/-1/1/1/0/349
MNKRIRLIDGSEVKGYVSNKDPTTNSLFVFVQKDSRMIMRYIPGTSIISVKDIEEESVTAETTSYLQNYFKEVNRTERIIEGCAQHINYMSFDVTLGPYGKKFVYDRDYKKRKKLEEADLQLQNEHKQKDIHPFYFFIHEDNNVYWNQRFRLFSKFDDGILLDEESFYSVTPQRIAEHLAERCRCHLIVDLFSGCGGNSIQFAYTCNRVIGVEMDAKRISYAQNNAKIYKVENYLEFIQANVLNIYQNLVSFVDVVFMSPPWGGPEYKDQKTFNLHSVLISGVSLFDLILKVLKAFENVVVFLPRNLDEDQILELAAKSGVLTVELERHVVSKKVKTCAVYFGKYFQPI